MDADPIPRRSFAVNLPFPFTLSLYSALKRVIIIIVRHDALLSCGNCCVHQPQYTTFGAVMPYFLSASFETRPTECEIERPKRHQKQYYSGKKKDTH